ncbi:MAG: hypothetical protein FWD59_10200, partial [Micrococcales bacterium]|nr:hypothetical protein [Micrococcales bacterium]
PLRRLLLLGLAIAAIGTALELLYVRFMNNGYPDSPWTTTTVLKFFPWIVARPVLSLTAIGVVGCAVVLAMLLISPRTPTSAPAPTASTTRARWRTSPWFRLAAVSIAILAMSIAAEWVYGFIRERSYEPRLATELVPAFDYSAALFYEILDHLKLFAPALFASGAVLQLVRPASRHPAAAGGLSPYGV